MNFDHYWNVVRAFKGPAAERLVLLTYVISIPYDPKQDVNPGLTDPLLSVHEVAVRCGMFPENVRKILRRLEGRTPGTLEPGKWLYPVRGEARQGDTRAKQYWIPLDPPPPLPDRPKIVRNPTGKGGKKPSKEVPRTGGESEVPGTSPSPGDEVPRTSPTRFPEPPQGRFGEPTNRNVNKNSNSGGPTPPRPTRRPGESTADFIDRLAAEARAKREAAQAPPPHQSNHQDPHP